MATMPNPSSRELFVSDDPEWFVKWCDAFVTEIRIADARGAMDCSDDCPGCECGDDPARTWGGPCSHCRMH